jgi:urease accessory protein
MLSRVLPAATTLAATTFAVPAFAHSTDVMTSNAFVSGLLHPLLGVDHLLAMLAVGIWAAQQPDSQRKTIPLAFMFTLLAGYLLAFTGIALPAVESGIAASVLVLGVLATLAARLPRAVTMVITSGFALLHGYAHGVESAVASATLFGAGFLASSFGLQMFGAKAANALLAQQRLLLKLSGFAIAATGATLLAV